MNYDKQYAEVPALFGTEHEATTITAENKLKRDVRDFIVRARTEKWP